MKRAIGFLIIILSIIGGLYVGGWLLFINPILEACQHFDAGTLTGTIVGVTIIKCVFASGVGTTIGYIGMLIGYVLASEE